MTRQLRHGARKMIDLNAADRRDIRALLRLAQEKTKSNPVYAAQLMDQALDILVRLEQREHDELEPMLERRERTEATADMAQRLAAAERAISDLKKQVAGLQGVVAKDRNAS